MTSFWISCQGEQLEQGDYLPGCWIPLVGADFDPSAAEPEIAVGRSNLIQDFLDSLRRHEPTLLFLMNERLRGLY